MSSNVKLTSDGIKMLATELIDVYESRKTPFSESQRMAEDEERFYEQRISDLEQLLYSAELVPASSEEHVELGSEVTLFDPFLDEVETYKLVHPVEASPIRKNISVESILGRELLFKKKGDDIYVTLYGETIRYDILEVK